MAKSPHRIIRLTFLFLLVSVKTQTGLQKSILNSALGFTNIYDCNQIPNSEQYMLAGYTSSKNFAVITISSSSAVDKNFLISGFSSRVSRLIDIEPGVLFMVGSNGARKVNSSDGSLIKSISAMSSVKINAVTLIHNTDFLVLVGYSDKLYRQYKTSDLSKIGIDTNVGVERARILLQRGFSPILLYSCSPGSSVSSIDYTNRSINPSVLTASSTDSIMKIIQGRKKNEILFSGTDSQVIEGNDITGQLIGVHTLLASTSSIFEIHLISGGDILVAGVSSAYKVLFYDLKQNLKLSYVINSSDRTFTFCHNDSKTLFSVYNNDKMDIYQYVQDVACTDSNCVKCGFRDEYCLECGTGWIREGGNCVKNCPQDKYYNTFSKICEQTPCAADHVFFGGNCYLCPSPKIFDERDSTCYSNCQDRDPKCGNCKAGTVECKDCVSGYEFDAAGVCKKIPPITPPPSEANPPPNPNPPTNDPSPKKEDQSPKNEELPEDPEKKIKPKNDNKKETEEMEVIGLPVSVKAYKSSFGATSTSLFSATAFTSFSSPNSRSSSLRLIQIFQYYSLLEREYNFPTQLTLEAFEGNLFDQLNISFLEEKERYKDNREDKVAAKVPLSYIKASEGQLVSLGINLLIGIVFWLVRLKYFIKVEPKKRLGENKSIAKKTNTCLKILEMFDSGWFFVLFYDFMIEFVIAATQNIFFGSIIS